MIDRSSPVNCKLFLFHNSVCCYKRIYTHTHTYIYIVIWLYMHITIVIICNTRNNNVIFVYLSVCLSVCLSIYLSIDLSIYLSLLYWYYSSATCIILHAHRGACLQTGHCGSESRRQWPGIGRCDDKVIAYWKFAHFGPLFITSMLKH